MPTFPRFRRHTLYLGEPSERTLCVVGDLNADGVPEIVIGAREPRAELFWLGRTPSGQWEPHLIAVDFGRIEAGGDLADLDGDGDLDLVTGEDYRGNALYWWECPDDPTGPWTQRVICYMPANQSHDQMIADVDGDGRPEVYFWNQGGAALYWARVPHDPRVSPWPTVELVAAGVRSEGLAVADVDGDGRKELVAGLSWYRLLPGGRWEPHPFAEGYVSPKSVAADLDGDGRVEIVISEGDASLNGREYGRLVLFRAGGDPEAPWEVEVLHDRLLEPHSLQVGDFDGDGRPELFVGEMGLPNGVHPHPPALRMYRWRGGRFEEHVIDRGVGTHEAKAIILDGRAGIAGKPYRNLRSEAPRGREVDAVHLWLPE